MIPLKARLVDAEERQRRMAELDSLTGIANRRASTPGSMRSSTPEPALPVRHASPRP